MEATATGPIRAYCRGCRVERRFVFSAWATASGSENTVRPRAEMRRCATCGRSVLRLADVSDATALVETVVDEWIRSHPGGLAAATGLDLADARGMLSERLWSLYLVWRPFDDGRGTFRGYALGLLRKKLYGWIADNAGGVRTHRNGHGRDALRYPRAHSLAVSESLDALVDRASDPEDQSGGRRLELALGAIEADFANDRSLDLAGVLAAGDRAAARDLAGGGLESDPRPPG